MCNKGGIALIILCIGVYKFCRISCVMSFSFQLKEKKVGGETVLEEIEKVQSNYKVSYLKLKK